MKYKTERSLRDASCVIVTLIFCVHKQIVGMEYGGKYVAWEKYKIT